MTHGPIEIETVRAGSHEVAYTLECRLPPLSTRVMKTAVVWKTASVQAKTQPPLKAVSVAGAWDGYLAGSGFGCGPS